MSKVDNIKYRTIKTAKTLESHCQRRLSERYALRYTQVMRETLLSKVHKKEVVLVLKQSNRVTIFDIEYKLGRNDIGNSFEYKAGDTITLRAAYDKQRRTFITFLTTDMVPPAFNGNDSELDEGSADLVDTL